MGVFGFGGVFLCSFTKGLAKRQEAAQSSREDPSSPNRVPDVRQLADTFHLDARVHKKELAQRPILSD